MENKAKQTKRVRHICGISGGKDSTGLAILLHRTIPNLEFFFCDTEKELPETYEYLDRVESRLGIKIKRLKAKIGFDKWLEMHGNFLPSAQARWCTPKLKLKPLEDFVGDDIAYSYIGIRADEDRGGYFSTKNNIQPVYIYKEKDFKIVRFGTEIYNQQKVINDFNKLGISLPITNDGYDISDVKTLLTDSGIGLPKYYEWRTRSGCYFCFFQRQHEWVGLSERHPELFKKASNYEKINPDGTRFTWIQGRTLKELLENKDIIIKEHNKKMIKEKAKKTSSKKTLCDILETVLDDDDLGKPCLTCTL